MRFVGSLQICLRLVCGNRPRYTWRPVLNSQIGRRAALRGNTAMSLLPEATFVPSEEELDYIEYLYPALLTYDRRKAQDAADQWTRLSKSVADALSNRLSGAKFAVVGSRHP